MGRSGRGTSILCQDDQLGAAWDPLGALWDRLGTLLGHLGPLGTGPWAPEMCVEVVYWVQKHVLRSFIASKNTC